MFSVFYVCALTDAQALRFSSWGSKVYTLLGDKAVVDLPFFVEESSGDPVTDEGFAGKIFVLGVSEKDGPNFANNLKENLQRKLDLIFPRAKFQCTVFYIGRSGVVSSLIYFF